MQPTTDDAPRRNREPPGTLGRRLAWFAVLWLAGLGTTAAVAYGLRALLFM
jgi:hypothetical protein